MRARRGNSYPIVGAPVPNNRKRAKLTTSVIRNFDALPDDIVSSILVKLGSTADCPADFVAALLTCKRFNCLGFNPVVLSQAASPETFAVNYSKWSPEAQRFLQRCADAGNAEASYTLGMIQFYCCCNHRTGAALMALKSHGSALYSLAIIQFNGSGSSKFIKDLTGGVTLCARAAFLGHIDAIRELGHCLKDGYGISKNISEGERLLLQANAGELASICSTPELIPGPRLLLPPYPYHHANGYIIGSELRLSLLPPKCHPVNRFLAGWNRGKSLYSGYRICSYVGCGRLETRMHEFRRCSVCGVMNYCSRGCQARDWTIGHNRDCRPMVRFANVNVNGGGGDGGR